MSEPKQTPPVEQAEEPKNNAPVNQGVSFLTATVIAASIAAFSAVISVWYVQTHANASSAAPRFVFMDGNAIFKAQVKAFAAGPDAGSPDAAQKAAKEFSVKLNAGLTPYREAGYIILNSAVAMNVPEGLDITNRIAKQVGVEIQ
jgi:glycerol dehydrogenase-like iron-containing ADH family enzyme